MLPAIQDEQVPEPAEVEIEPAGQSVHDKEPSVEYLPAAQVPEQAAVCKLVVEP